MKLINYSKYSEVQKLIWQIIIEIGDNCNGMLILLCNIRRSRPEILKTLDSGLNDVDDLDDEDLDMSDADLDEADGEDTSGNLLSVEELVEEDLCALEENTQYNTRPPLQF